MKYLKGECTDGIERPTSIFLKFNKDSDTMELDIYLLKYRNVKDVKDAILAFKLDMKLDQRLQYNRTEPIYKRIGTKYIY